MQRPDTYIFDCLFAGLFRSVTLDADYMSNLSRDSQLDLDWTLIRTFQHKTML